MTRIYKKAGPAKKVKMGNPGEMPLGGGAFDNSVLYQGERIKKRGAKEMSSPQKPGEGPGSALRQEERRNQ